MKVGIVGMPNAGKSTLFNALTRAAAETAGYPFTTVDPNVAVAPVPDERLEAVARMLGSTPIVHETLELHDIAGLVRGAHAGEGLGNRFLASIRETDVICHVVRAHTEEGVPHPDGRVDPLGDAQLVEAELLLADLESAERRRERVAKQAKAGSADAVAEHEWLERVVAALERGEPVRSVPVPEAAPEAGVRLGALTAKPVLYVANVDEEVGEPPADLAAHARANGGQAIVLPAKLEAELAELDAADAEAMRAELGNSEPGLERLVRAAHSLLGLIAFFTAAGAGEEARAWSLRQGLTAWHAAGRIHTDFQERFVRAEVIAWDELVSAGGYPEARERGTLRTEGRDYVVRDGEVLLIKSSP